MESGLDLLVNSVIVVCTFGEDEKEVIPMDQWLSVIQDVGFPIFVSFYLMHRVESKLEEIKNALLSLSNV